MEEEEQKSQKMGCLTVRMWAILIASFQILFGGIVFVVGVIGLFETPNRMAVDIKGNQRRISMPMGNRFGITKQKETDEAYQKYVFSITCYSFLLLLSIGVFVKGIILNIGIKKEHITVMKIWKILMILNVLAGFIGFITVSLIMYPKFEPMTVVLICNGMWGIFCIWVAKKYETELEDSHQRALLLRRPKSRR